MGLRAAVRGDPANGSETTALAVGMPLRSFPSRPALGLLGAALIALLVAIVGGVALGSVAIAPGDTLAILVHRFLGIGEVRWAASAEAIVIDLRLPRVLAAVIVGGGLAVAGAALQGLLRNPLADPYVLGTASGAALGAAIGILVPVRLLVLEFGLVHGLAFLGALGAVAVVYRLSRRGTLASLTGLLLTGYAVGSLLAAGLALVMYLSGQNLRQIFSYLLGSFDGATWLRVGGAAPLILLGVVLLALRARSLNAFLMGDDAAAQLGLDVGRERTAILALSALVTAAGVAISGLIGFVGLIVPHVVRLLAGPNARAVVPFSALFGGAFMASADLLARLAGEVPVGVVTAVVGAPFFLYLLRRAHAGYEL